MNHLQRYQIFWEKHITLPNFQVVRTEERGAHSKDPLQLKLHNSFKPLTVSQPPGLVATN